MTRQRRRLVIWGAILIVVVAVVTAATLAMNGRRSTPNVVVDGAATIPTGRVTRGSLDLTVHMTGDLRAARQAALTAPSVGGSLRILSVVETGTAVAEGDVIMAFDPADQVYALEQAESELLEAEQEMIKRRAEIDVQQGQDALALLVAKFDLRRAQLDVAVDADLIAPNELKIRHITLEEAKKKLETAQEDINARAATSKAAVAVLEERRTRAKLAAERAKQNMELLEIKASIAGIVSVRENMDASGGFFFSGMTLPTYRVGDSVFPGRPVIDVFDVTGMEIKALVNEQERVNVSPGQRAKITSNVTPGELTASISTVAGLGRPDRAAGPLRQFEVTLQLEKPDIRLRPGTSVRIVVQGTTVENVLLVPRQAVFEKDGKPVVYERAASGSGFVARNVKIVHRTESRVALEGINEGTVIALIDPETAAKPASSTATPAAPPTPGVKR